MTDPPESVLETDDTFRLGTSAVSEAAWELVESLRFGDLSVGPTCPLDSLRFGGGGDDTEPLRLAAFRGTGGGVCSPGGLMTLPRLGDLPLVPWLDLDPFLSLLLTPMEGADADGFCLATGWLIFDTVGQDLLSDAPSNSLRVNLSALSPAISLKRRRCSWILASYFCLVAWNRALVESKGKCTQINFYYCERVM